MYRNGTSPIAAFNQKSPNRAEAFKAAFEIAMAEYPFPTTPTTKQDC
jgi:hypothetical protein